MIEQTARVLSIQAGCAWVMPEQANCVACSSTSHLEASGCSKGMALFRFLKPQPEKLHAVNPLHAKPGDLVVIGTQSNTLVLYSVLAYLLPLVSLLVFAILGEALAQSLHFPSEVVAIFAGLAGLLSGFRLAIWLAGHIAPLEHNQPVILRHKEAVLYPLHTASLKALNAVAD